MWSHFTVAERGLNTPGVTGTHMTNDGGETSVHVQYDSETETYHATYEWSSQDPLSSIVVQVVAAVTDRDPLTFDPLATVVEPSSLDTIFSPRSDGSSRIHGAVTFPFEGYRVTVHATGEIVIEPPSGEH